MSRLPNHNQHRRSVLRGTKNLQAVKTLLRAFWHGRTRKMLLGMLLAACTALSGAALLGISGWFITATAIAGMSTATALAFDVFMPSATIRLLAIGRTGARYTERLVTHEATMDALVDVRERLFKAYARPANARLWKLQPARRLFRLTRDLDAAESFYIRLVVPLFAAITMVIAVSIVLGIQNVWLGIIALVWLLGTGLGMNWWLLASSALLSAQQVKLAELVRRQVTDLSAGQAELIMAGQYEPWRQRLLKNERRLAEIDRQLNRLDSLATGGWQIINALNLAATLLIGAWLVQQGQFAAATATFLILITLSMMEPFAAVRRGAQEWGRSLISARRLQKPLEESAKPTSTATNRLPIPTDQGIVLQMEGVRYRLHDGQTEQAEAASFIVHEGERVALVGPSGSGKTTLLMLAAGERSASAGSVMAQSACWLTQRTELFQDTVRNNVNLQQQPLTDAAIWAALESAGLAEYIAQHPEGLDTRLGEGGLGLSGGQARRLALARLFVSERNFWLLDEPTEGLDAETARDVLVRLEKHLAGRTLLLATHLRREAMLCNRLILLKKGIICLDVHSSQPEFNAILKTLRDD